MISEKRLKVLNKIKEFEKKGLWCEEVEDNPETKILLPNEVDYLSEKLLSKVLSFFANKIAIKYYEKLIRKGQFVIKDVVGLENYRKVCGGAILTCNHFSPLDNYAVYRSIRKELKKGQVLYKVIKEGNFTNFKGLYGFFFRHCNTLPLSSNIQTMKNLFKSVKFLLDRGEKILIYPEQAMWWNYRKPRPLKSGAFRFAVKNCVPIIPVFITMKNGKGVDNDGLCVQEMTVNFLSPIYPQKHLNEKANVEYMKTKNFEAWKNTYEEFYGFPLVYGE